MKWLKPGGYIFCRESCFHQSGDHKRKNNPTHYRQPSGYTKIFEQTHVEEADGSFYEFELVGCKCVGTSAIEFENHKLVSIDTRQEFIKVDLTTSFSNLKLTQNESKLCDSKAPDESY
ncbi:hypothetical protein KC19_VG149000 [Ceratodon purpureus]|uniref:phosphoethanolamine N-methyltransferase n=1 Tax=Ceratodon purpureus TaxID=3225 RepID=A0A8T0HQA1_CERPU|nr:hypothetical protein KC19_VG149000 [Ceratodon purpureus]